MDLKVLGSLIFILTNNTEVTFVSVDALIAAPVIEALAPVSQICRPGRKRKCFNGRTIRGWGVGRRMQRSRATPHGAGSSEEQLLSRRHQSSAAEASGIAATNSTSMAGLRLRAVRLGHRFPTNALWGIQASHTFWQQAKQTCSLQSLFFWV